MKKPMARKRRPMPARPQWLVILDRMAERAGHKSASKILGRG